MGATRASAPARMCRPVVVEAAIALPLRLTQLSAFVVSVTVVATVTVVVISAGHANAAVAAHHMRHDVEVHDVHIRLGNLCDTYVRSTANTAIHVSAA